MNMVAFDWSGKGIDVTFDGETSVRMDNVDSLLAILDEPHVIVCEATYESYVPERRDAFTLACAADGHDLRTFKPRFTARLRNELGIEKTDANDALVIFRVASLGIIPMKKAGIVDPDYRARHTAINREHTIGRFVGESESLVAEFEQAIPKETLTDIQKLAFLTKAGEWRGQFISGIVRASRHATSRNDFERLTGMYANGYGCHLRSDIYHWGYRGGTAGPRMSISDLRREVRRAYHILSEKGTLAPEKGIPLPSR